MKTTYKHPVTVITSVRPQQPLAQSGGVGNGSTLGNAYNGGDVSYSREQGSGWSEDD